MHSMPFIQKSCILLSFQIPDTAQSSHHAEVSLCQCCGCVAVHMPVANNIS